MRHVEFRLRLELELQLGSAALPNRKRPPNSPCMALGDSPEVLLSTNVCELVALSAASVELAKAPADNTLVALCYLSASKNGRLQAGHHITNS